MSNDASPVPCGPYDDRYARCPCFWGREPGSLIRRLEAHIPSFAGLTVLDAGCGEGKNAAYLSERGAVVHAVDCSAHQFHPAGDPPSAMFASAIAVALLASFCRLPALFPSRCSSPAWALA